MRGLPTPPDRYRGGIPALRLSLQSICPRAERLLIKHSSLAIRLSEKTALNESLETDYITSHELQLKQKRNCACNRRNDLWMKFNVTRKHSSAKHWCSTDSSLSENNETLIYRIHAGMFSEVDVLIRMHAEHKTRMFSC